MSFPTGANSGAGSSGSSETTQLLVKTAVEALNVKAPALGQALAAASIPVVLTAAQISALEPLLGLTDTQLRATAVPISAASLPLPTDATTETTQLLVKTAVQDLDTKTGEVQESPTANTTLARLKDLLTGIVLAAGTHLIGKVGFDQTTPGTSESVSVKARPKTVITVLSAVTSNQTSAVQAITSGSRTIQASIVGTGTVSATVAWYGNNTNATTGGILLATSTLSGTTTDTSGAELPAEWPFIYCILTAITGTGAAVTATVGV